MHRLTVAYIEPLTLWRGADVLSEIVELSGSIANWTRALNKQTGRWMCSSECEVAGAPVVAERGRRWWRHTVSLDL